MSQIKHYQHLDVSDGLLTNQLTNLVEGPDGAIWITTEGAGICRYDGRSFQHFNDPDSFGTSYYYAACADQEELWFGGENFLLRRTGRINKLYALPGLGKIHQVLSFEDSILYCIAEDTSITIDKKSGNVKPVDLPRLKINQVVTHQQNIWAATDSGVWQLVADRWYQRYPASPVSINNCTALLSTNTDGLLVVDERIGLVKVEGQASSLVLPASALPASEINFLKQGALGEVYFGTQNRGIQILQLLDSLWLTIDEKQLRFNHVTAMIFDQWENAWVTTAGGGLTKFYSEGYSLYPSSLLSGRYFRKMEKWGDTLAINYNNQNWDIIADPQWVPQPIDLLPGQSVSARFLTSEGCWYASDQKLIFARDSSIHIVDSSGKYTNFIINDFEKVDSQTILVATNNGMLTSKLELDTTMTFLQKRISGQPAKDLIKDGRGNIWFYNDREIGIYSDSSFIVRTISGKPATLAVFDETTTLLGTRDAGLFLVDLVEGVIQVNEISSPTFPLRSIRAMVVDRKQHVWIALQNQIMECHFARSSPLKILKVYDRSSGLPRFEIYKNAIQTGPGDHIYVGTSVGLLQIVSESNLQTVSGPVLSLVNVSTSQDRFDFISDSMLTKLHNIQPREGNLNFHFEAIDQRVPEPISYFYRLSPNMRDWTVSRSAGDFQFYELPPGHYSFAIKAINRNGRSSEIITIPFTILQHFYLKWWFVALILALIANFIYFFYRWRLNIQKRKNQQINEKLAMQNQVLRLEQAARRLQMNPHFIFNALQSIQSKIMEGDRDDARADLQIFSKLMRGYLDHAREEKILLEDEIGLLNQYLQVEQSLKAGRFDYEIVVPDDIDPSFIEIPAMLLQPFVENAIKHGLPQDGIKGQIKIRFGWFGKHLSCTIADNGPGMSSTKEGSAHRSSGMDITRQRLKAFFDQTKLDPLLIKSQSDSPGGKRKGTRIRVLLPIEF